MHDSREQEGSRESVVENLIDQTTVVLQYAWPTAASVSLSCFSACAPFSHRLGSLRIWRLALQGPEPEE